MVAGWKPDELTGVASGPKGTQVSTPWLWDGVCVMPKFVMRTPSGPVLATSLAKDMSIRPLYGAMIAIDWLKLIKL